MGARRLTEREFLELQSPNWYEFYEKVGVPENLWSKVDEEWSRLYAGESPKLYPDARPCLATLRSAGLRLALVSNGSEARVGGELASLGLNGAFESVLCGRNVEELKPSPAMLQKTMGALGLSPTEVVYVGDAPADVQASKNAGVRSIAIARNPILGERLRKEGPDYAFEGLGAMARFLVGAVSGFRKAGEPPIL